MIFKGILSLLVIFYFQGFHVKGQNDEIPIEVTVQDNQNIYSGLVVLKCNFSVDSEKLTAVWWRLNDEIIFFHQNGQEGSKLGNHGDMILDYGYTLAETPGGQSDHHIVIDTNLCYDGALFECQVVTNDEREGKGQAELKLKDPEITLDVCDSASSSNCTKVGNNATHAISCVAKGTRHEPNITIFVSDDVMTDGLIDSSKDETNCYHEAEEKVDVTIATTDPRVIACVVQDGDKKYTVEKVIGKSPSSSATMLYLPSFLTAVLFARLAI